MKKIFVRVPSGQGKKAPRRIFVCQGKVLKKMKHQDRYKVLLFPPFEKEPKISWFSIEDVVVFHSGEKRKRNDFNNQEKELKRKNMNYMSFYFHP